MSDTPSELARRLQAEGEKTRNYFEGLSDAQWNRQAYTDGACWSVREVLAHFVASELSHQKLIANICAGGAGSPDDFDIDRYNERKVGQLSDRDAASLLQDFSAARQQTTALVEGLTLEDLSLTGRHPFLGQSPLADIIRMIYRHNQIHQREIRKILAEDGTTV